VPSATIDKDWALGHLLNALYSFDDFSNNFIFKGGTCLRKCYYENYRFSEDLDFTLLDESLVVDKSLISRYLFIAEKNSGIKFGKNIVINRQSHNDQPQGYEIIIPFWGIDHKPNQRPLPEIRWQSKIKIDISFSEKLILRPVVKPIFHPYSDSSFINSLIVGIIKYPLLLR
jgi:predicted nucleotidyltransferase component of viral defense system